MGDPLRTAALALHALSRPLRHRNHRLGAERRSGRHVLERRWREGYGGPCGGGGRKAGGPGGNDSCAGDEAPGGRGTDEVCECWTTHFMLR